MDKANNKIWVLLRKHWINHMDYVEYHPVFLAWFLEKPTKNRIINLLSGKSLYLWCDEGGGEGEDMIYNNQLIALIEIEEGELLKW